MGLILQPCKVCGTLPEIEEGYDTLEIKCPTCGRCVYTVGDYYDEGFMRDYEDTLIEEWNNAEV